MATFIAILAKRTLNTVGKFAKSPVACLIIYSGVTSKNNRECDGHKSRCCVSYTATTAEFQF